MASVDVVDVSLLSILKKYHRLSGGIFTTWTIYYGVRIRSYSGPHFPAFELNLERCSICRKMRTRITPNTDTFYAVGFFLRKQITVKRLFSLE